MAEDVSLVLWLYCYLLDLPGRRWRNSRGEHHGGERKQCESYLEFHKTYRMLSGTRRMSRHYLRPVLVQSGVSICLAMGYLPVMMVGFR